MPVPPDELHKYYYILGCYYPKGVQEIDDIEDGNFNILKSWNGEVESPADLDGYKLVLSRGKPAALLDKPLLLVSTPVREVFRRVVSAADFNEVDMSGCLSDPKADYTLINVRRIIRLLDHHPQKREIDVAEDITLDYTKLPPDMHLFLADEVPGAVFISGLLAVELAAIKPNNAVYITVHDIKRPKGHSRALVAPKPKPKRL